MISVDMTDKQMRDTVEFMVNSIDTSVTDYEQDSSGLDYLESMLAIAEKINEHIGSDLAYQSNADVIADLRSKINERRSYL